MKASLLEEAAMTKPSGNVRARGLGTELQRLRTRRGLSLREVAERLDWSMATLSRTENGRRRISPEDLGSLLMLYEVPTHERERLFAFARRADQPGWWETGQAIIPNQLVSLIAFESQATRITVVQMMLIPGMLQLPEYTREVMVGTGVHPKDVEPRVAARLGRQALLTRPDPPTFTAIIDQGALHRELGDSAVMAAQLHHLVKLADRPAITIQVIPFRLGAHPAVNGSYVALEFDNAPTIVHLEHTWSSLFLDDPDDTERYKAEAVTLQKIALNPAQSLDMIAKVAGQYERRGDRGPVNPPVA